MSYNRESRSLASSLPWYSILASDYQICQQRSSGSQHLHIILFASRHPADPEVSKSLSPDLVPLPSHSMAALWRAAPYRTRTNPVIDTSIQSLLPGHWSVARAVYSLSWDCAPVSPDSPVLYRFGPAATSHVIRISFSPMQRTNPTQRQDGC